MSLTDERKELEKNKESLKAARTAINNKLVELGGTASASFNDIPEKTTELANTITATNKEYIDSKTGDLTNLQTQDKTNLVNAINEILNGSEINATDVSFNDTETQLGASNVQDAINAIVSDLKLIKTDLEGQAARLASINTLLEAEIGAPQVIQ